jgi:hypothetical protein
VRAGSRGQYASAHARDRRTHPASAAPRINSVRKLIAMGSLVVALAACAPGGGNSPSPYGGGTAPAATTVPQAAPASTPLPLGSAMTDPYGYGY